MIYLEAIILFYLFVLQDGVVSPEDCDVIMSQGLGMRYAFMGPWETGYLNADGKVVLYL